jgi:hypothetical protein
MIQDQRWLLIVENDVIDDDDDDENVLLHEDVHVHIVDE